MNNKILRTHTLKPEGNHVGEIDLSDIYLVVADIDYTLIDTNPGHASGINSIGNILGFEIAREVDKIFHLTVDGHRHLDIDEWEGKITFYEIIKRTEELQASFKDRFGYKAWSRETWIVLAAEELNRQIKKELVIKARDAYWTALTKNSPFYNDVNAFIELLRVKKIPLILMSSSDAIMQLRDNLTFDYDPEYSRKYKRRRIDKLGLNPCSVVIGDPIDKPHASFFDLVEEEIENQGIKDKDKVLFIGDSPRNDLMVPAARGYKTLNIKR